MLPAEEHTCRRRCWENDWVIDCDIRKFFDAMPWDLAVKAIQAVTDLPSAAKTAATLVSRSPCTWLIPAPHRGHGTGPGAARADHDHTILIHDILDDQRRQP